MISRLIMLRKGTYPDFPEMGVDIVGRYRFAFEDECSLLSMDIEEQANRYLPEFYPISIYCPTCHKDSTEIFFYDEISGDVSYECTCGYSSNLNVNTATNIKLQWKVDWPMRWMVEKVTFETSGMDHSAANGSKAVSERVVREIYNYEPPVFTPYNFIGIKGGGAKMSSSKGNVLTLTDLLKVYDKILFFGSMLNMILCTHLT